MKIKVNGKLQEIEKKTSIAALLIINEVEMPDMVSVQLNGEFIKRENFAGIILNENDEIDFLYFMGGGQSPIPSLQTDCVITGFVGADLSARKLTFRRQRVGKPTPTKAKI